MENITKVYLMNVLLEKDYAHTMYFETAAAQQAFFQKKIKTATTYTDFSYQRKDNVIRVPTHIDTLYAAKVNYCMYQNAQYSNKWFYAFITDMKYVDDGRTDVYIQTDCMQTWMFDITVKHSFVEREHATTDTIGANTIDEGLELGEYVCESVIQDEKLKTCKYVILTTEFVTPDPDGDGKDDKPLAINMGGGIYYAGGAYICNDMGDVVAIVQAFSASGRTDAVTAVYMVPENIIKNDNDALQFSGQIDPAQYNFSITKPNTMLGYTPRNKKLLTFPFVCLVGSNNAGSSNVYRYEDFNNSDTANFRVYGVPVVGGSIKTVPVNYKYAPLNHDEGLMCGKFPTLSWSADMFTNWLTQNSVNIGMGVVGGVVQIVGGIATMAATSGAGAAIGGASIVGGINTIANQLAQVHQQSFTPNSARGNTNGGDITTATGTNTFYYYKMTIKPEYARIVDEFFDMFGYKCNRVKVPAKNHRQNYWYTKTIDANIVGGIPQDDLQTIKDCYNRGITFWKTEEYFRNYSVSNNTV